MTTDPQKKPIHPSKERAAFSLLTGLAGFGSLAGAGASLGRRYRQPNPSAPNRAERAATNIGILFLYAALALSITIGWRQTHTFAGVVVGVLIGMAAGFVLSLLTHIVAVVVQASRSQT